MNIEGRLFVRMGLGVIRIAPDSVFTAGDGHERRQQIVAMRAFMVVQARIAQLAERQAGGDARARVGTGIATARDQALSQCIAIRAGEPDAGLRGATPGQWQVDPGQGFDEDSRIVGQHAGQPRGLFPTGGRQRRQWVGMAQAGEGFGQTGPNLVGAPGRRHPVVFGVFGEPARGEVFLKKLVDEKHLVGDLVLVEQRQRAAGEHHGLGHVATDPFQRLAIVGAHMPAALFDLHAVGESRETGQQRAFHRQAMRRRMPVLPAVDAFAVATTQYRLEQRVVLVAQLALQRLPDETAEQLGGRVRGPTTRVVLFDLQLQVERRALQREARRILQVVPQRPPVIRQVFPQKGLDLAVVQFLEARMRHASFIQRQGFAVVQGSTGEHRAASGGQIGKPVAPRGDPRGVLIRASMRQFVQAVEQQPQAIAQLRFQRGHMRKFLLPAFAQPIGRRRAVLPRFVGVQRDFVGQRPWQRRAIFRAQGLRRQIIGQATHQRGFSTTGRAEQYDGAFVGQIIQEFAQILEGFFAVFPPALAVGVAALVDQQGQAHEAMIDASIATRMAGDAVQAVFPWISRRMPLHLGEGVLIGCFAVAQRVQQPPAGGWEVIRGPGIRGRLLPFDHGERADHGGIEGGQRSQDVCMSGEIIPTKPDGSSGNDQRHDNQTIRHRLMLQHEAGSGHVTTGQDRRFSRGGAFFPWIPLHCFRTACPVHAIRDPESA